MTSASRVNPNKPQDPQRERLAIQLTSKEEKAFRQVDVLRQITTVEFISPT